MNPSFEEQYNQLLSNPYENFQQIITLLEENTGEGKAVQPSGSGKWEQFASRFYTDKLFEIAEKVHLKRYQHQLLLQSEKRYHKGVALHQIGWVNIFLGNKIKRRRFTILALIEDIISDDTDYKMMAYHVLINEFGFSDDEISEIVSYIQSNKNVLGEALKYPEAIAEALKTEEKKLFAPEFMSTQFLKFQLHKLELAETPLSKGQIFENIVQYVLKYVDGFVISSNLNVGETQGGDREYEIDLVVRNFVNDPIFKEFGRYILVECKNWQQSPGTEQLNHFVSKMRFHDCKCGIFASRDGISGIENNVDRNRAKLTKLKAFHRDGIIILEITLNDLQRVIQNKIDIKSLFIEKYEDTRFDRMKQPVE